MEEIVTLGTLLTAPWEYLNQDRYDEGICE